MVGRAEAVVDRVDALGQGRQPVGEGAALGVVLARLARVEADVLEQRDLSVGQGVDRGAGAQALRDLGADVVVDDLGEFLEGR